MRAARQDPRRRRRSIPTPRRDTSAKPIPCQWCAWTQPRRPRIRPARAATREREWVREGLLAPRLATRRTAPSIYPRQRPPESLRPCVHDGPRKSRTTPSRAASSTASPQTTHTPPPEKALHVGMERTAGQPPAQHIKARTDQTDR